MTTPNVSLLLCTVRGNHGYLNRPEWDTIGKVVEDLENQVDAPPFELVVVDGLRNERDREFSGDFPIRHISPSQHSPWVRSHKVAISAYRNSGIAAARGELLINLDDCCRLPPNFVSTFWRAWSKHGVALSMTWPKQGDVRRPGPVTYPGQVYGFGSYPRELALELNGYDEAYDGGQGLEDCDWSWRLYHAGLKQALVTLPGFSIEPQTGHDPRAIDPVKPLCKCCNQAWHAQRMQRDVRVANTPDLWPREWLEKIVGPCWLLKDGKCGHHGYRNPCAYLDRGFPLALDPEAAMIFEHPPAVDLHKLSEEYK